MSSEGLMHDSARSWLVRLGQDGFPFDGDDDPEFDNVDEEFPDDCGMTPSGQCTKAGSEECDWECDLMLSMNRRRAKKNVKPVNALDRI